ncbi:MAG: Uma2 family endonuclease [Candidatus Cybelea sp.]
MIARVPLVASDADVLRTSTENPAWRVERDASGALIMTPPTGIETSKRNAALTSMIHEWAEAHDYVAFDSNGGFRLPNKSIVAPDAALVTKETWASLSAEERDGFFPGAPAVAVELCSHTDQPLRLRAKLERLRRAGTSYVVLIDPYQGTIWTDGTAPAAFDVDFAQLLK